MIDGRESHVSNPHVLVFAILMQATGNHQVLLEHFADHIYLHESKVINRAVRYTGSLLMRGKKMRRTARLDRLGQINRRHSVSTRLIIDRDLLETQFRDRVFHFLRSLLVS